MVCPVYNESDWIDQLLEFVTTATVQPAEVFLIDGGSTDDTVYKIKNWQARYSHIHLLHNPHRYVPHALNLAIPKCSGDIIIRLDAHTKYAKDYFEQILKTLENTDANIVGGPMRPVGLLPFQDAVAIATCDSFGVGNSAFHFEKKAGYVDSVYLGAWKRDIFDKIGLFDEVLVRNQDDEFHYRARASGFKIYLNPSIRSYYYPRTSATKLFKQYYQYGLYKPLVLRKVSSETKLRHLIPSSFVLYLCSLPIGIQLGWWYGLPFFLYLAILLYKSLFANAPWQVRLPLLVVYPTIHIAYGLGFLAGLRKVLQQNGK